MLSGLVELCEESSNNLLPIGSLLSNHFFGEICEEKLSSSSGSTPDMTNIKHVRISANVVTEITSEILSGVTAVCVKQLDMLSYFLHEAYDSRGS